MAKMYPAVFPHLGNKMRNAEKKFYDTCENQLGEDWTVLYDIKYFGHRHRGKERGDIDFLLINTQLGIFCVEVKGGQEIFIKAGEWFTVPHGRTQPERISNPFDQVSEAKSVLLDWFINDIPNTRFPRPLGHFVVFPGAEVHQDLSITARRSLICDRNDLKDILSTITKISNSNSFKKTKLTEENIQEIRKSVLNDRSLLTLGQSHFSDAADAMEELTEQQRVAFQMLKNFKEVVVTGGAGTGKTVLAFNRACELASQGKRTMFLCHSNAVAIHLRRMIALNLGETLSIYSTSEFYQKVTDGHYSALYFFEFNYDYREYPDNKVVSRASFYEDMLKKALFIDVLVVDEAQLIPLNLCEMLMDFLPKIGERYIYIFGDTRQATLLFKKSALYLMPEKEQVQLDINCRTTHEIAVAAHFIFGETPRRNGRGTSGPKPMLALHKNGVSLGKRWVLGEPSFSSTIPTVARYLIETVGLKAKNIKNVVAGPSYHHGRWIAHSGVVINPDTWEWEDLISKFSNPDTRKEELLIGRKFDSPTSSKEAYERQMQLVESGHHVIETMALPDIQGLEADGVIFEITGLSAGLPVLGLHLSDELRELVEEEQRWSGEIAQLLNDSHPSVPLGTEIIDTSTMSDTRRALFEHFKAVVFAGMTRARYAVVFIGEEEPMALLKIMLGETADSIVMEVEQDPF